MPYPETAAYIRKQLTEGFSSDRIRRALEEAGYQDDIIDQLLKEAGADKQIKSLKKQSAGIEKVLLKNIVVVAIFALFIGSIFYFGSDFLMQKKEVFSNLPFTQKTDEDINVDFGRDSAISLKKGASIEVNLNDYIENKKYSPNQIHWFYTGQYCVSIKINEGIATITSNYQEGCPLTENIRFDAKDPDKKSAYQIIQIRII